MATKLNVAGSILDKEGVAFFVCIIHLFLSRIYLFTFVFLFSKLFSHTLCYKIFFCMCVNQVKYRIYERKYNIILKSCRIWKKYCYTQYRKKSKNTLDCSKWNRSKEKKEKKSLTCTRFELANSDFAVICATPRPPPLQWLILSKENIK